MNNLWDVIKINNKKYKNKIAIKYLDEKISYNSLYNEISEYSEIFDKSLKLSHKSKITIVMENGIDYVIILFVSAKLNLTIQTLGTYHTKNYLNDKIKKFNPDIIFTSSYLQDKINTKKKLKVIFDYKEYKYICNSNHIKKSNLKKEINNKKNYLIVESSGTTGKSKSIIFDQFTKLKRSLSAKKLYSLNSQDIIIATAPFDHSLGQRLLFLPIIIGGTLVILKNFHPTNWLQNVKKHHVTFSILVSSQIHQVIKSEKFNKSYLQSLKCLVSASFKLSEETKKKLLIFNFNLFEMYGLSEVGTVTNINLKEEATKLKSVGRVFQNNKIKIIKDNKYAKNFEIGEIVCGTNYEFSGYLNLQKKKRDFFKNYLRTGDMGYMDNEKYLYFFGRKKNIIKSSGINIYPETLEQKLRKNLGIDCSIIGIEDPLVGEFIKLIVEKKNKITHKKIMSFCFKNFESYEIPKQIVFTKKLPRTSLGKPNIMTIKSIFK
jgi:long-chain acyl-CoA synthetase